MLDIAREHKRELREKLALLVADLRDARAMRRGAIVAAKHQCRAQKLSARTRARELRARLLEELREAIRAERAAARSSCAVGLRDARGIANRVQRARLELLAERKYRREMRQIERSNRKRFLEAKRASATELRGESDETVRGNIPPEMVPLFDKVKKSIRGSDRMSRTEAFLHYAEEHPGEVLAGIEDQTDTLTQPPPRTVYAGADVPF